MQRFERSDIFEPLGTIRRCFGSARQRGHPTCNEGQRLTTNAGYPCSAVLDTTCICIYITLLSPSKEQKRKYVVIQAREQREKRDKSRGKGSKGEQRVNRTNESTRAPNKKTERNPKPRILWWHAIAFQLMLISIDILFFLTA